MTLWFTDAWFFKWPWQNGLEYGLLWYSTLLYKESLAIIFQIKLSNSFLFLWILVYFHHKFKLSKWLLFADLFFACVATTVLWLQIHIKAETKWPPFCRKYLWTIFFLKWYYCILIKVRLSLKQNGVYIVYRLDWHWGRDKNGHHFAQVIFDLFFFSKYFFF